MTICPSCHAAQLQTGPQRVTRELFDRVYETTLAGRRCLSCDETFVNAKLLQKFER